MQRLSQSPTDPAFVQDPYPFYDRARASGDLFWWEEYGMVAATSHRAVSALLRDRRFGRETPPELAKPVPAHLEPFEAVERHSLLAMEPPRHTRLRGLILRAFTSRRVQALAPGIESLCHALIDAFPAEGVEMLDAYCRPIPAIVICRLLGVPEERHPDLLAWSNAMVAMYQARRDRRIEDTASAASAEFSAFLRAYVEERRRRPADDLISELIAAEGADGKLDADELIGLCILLLNAGHEATVHTLGNGIRLMAQAGVTEVTQGTVEEILRLDPPLHLFDRWAYEEAEAFGHTFRRGDKVALLLGAANRDPAVYPDPADFDPHRTGPANTSFGAGLHFCVGAPLARLEIEIALRVLFDRLPALSLPEPPAYADVYHFHGLTRLDAIPA
ncbi:cytochrome P450 [Wenxinia marina]|uniref:Cytochrome P450 n=1 Tax=Wenxinia marina DSM 24838 TaxID=1123501 RepID=A0A0D0QF07_9RHOB|nr:cytochrome P450 [Wenxinia marina]KIQ69573.1 Cytochrome P450 [Wenxinia marina DSM 24838]GGL59440.1 cytochrome P450 [Wenxinia marina]